MMRQNKYFRKLYYGMETLLVRTSAVPSRNSHPEKRNLFLYFDYEREFSGHPSGINDAKVIRMLDILDRSGIKTTWYTVGKILTSYPGSIREITDRGHEIGSHTYAHKPPYYMSRDELKDDIIRFRENSREIPAKMTGFHAPNGLWSYSMFSPLANSGFTYDICGGAEANQGEVGTLKLSGGKCFYRLKTLGDDWPLFESRQTAKEVCEYFIMLSQTVPVGGIGGIGFHPWLITSDDQIFGGWIDFLEFAGKHERFNLRKAADYLPE